ncbi:MAG: isochorismate synthase [Rhodocyclaceae bacterium]|nr:isochorismate synthase [Rhodocyclaceae bacterium]
MKQQFHPRTPQQLLKHLANSQLQQRLLQLAEEAPGSALISLTLELGPGTHDWLDHLPGNSAYWYHARPASGEFRLGIGQALHLTSSGAQRFAALGNAYNGLMQDWRHNGQPMAFLGFSFDENGGTSELPSALLSIPALLLESRAGHCRVTLTSTSARIDDALLQWPQLLSQPAARQMPDCLPESDVTLAERAWVARVNAARRDILCGRLAKVVLARSRRWLAPAKIYARPLLEQLCIRQPDACIYAFNQGESTFLGATPENLVSFNGSEIESDALAGTAWPGSSALDGSKNQHEQSLVVAAIIEALTPLCQRRPHAHPIEVHPAGHLTHLRSRITGTALSGTKLFDLLRVLHPTPAVGGYPTAAAIDWLKAHSEQRSGWYSGGIGLLDSAGNGQISVALRSALIQGHSISLQAGAGIVADSDPWQELAETNAKLGTLLDALQGIDRAPGMAFAQRKSVS